MGVAGTSVVLPGHGALRCHMPVSRDTGGIGGIGGAGGTVDTADTNYCRYCSF